MGKYTKILIIVAILAVGFFAIRQLTTNKNNTSTPKLDTKKDTVYPVTLGAITNTLTLSGSVATDQIANLKFKNSGKLVWVGVKIGDHVRRGQAIASLDRSELRKSLATQLNNYRNTLSQFNDTQDQYRQTKEKLLVTDTIQRILDRTQYSLDNSVINYELTEMALQESVLISPIEGIVVNLDQPIAGANITPTSATFTIVNPNSLYFKADIDQADVNKIHLGQKVTLKLDSFPDQTIDSEITYIAFTPVLGQTSTVYEVRFKLLLDNNNQTYRLGMDGDANIILAQADNVLTIPTDAVNDDNGQRYVYLKSANKLIRQNIKTGIENDTVTQVTEGLSTNDQVVVIQK